jgi:hypothetical protein
VKAELQTHLNALKGYVDMKFDVLKGMMANDAPADEGGGEEFEKTMRESMLRMQEA